MGDTDEESDSGLNQTFAPTRSRVDKDKRRARNFSEELLLKGYMSEPSTSKLPARRPSNFGVTTRISTTSTSSAASSVPTAVSTTSTEATNMTSLWTSMAARFDQQDVARHNTVAMGGAQHRELCAEMRNNHRELRDEIRSMTQMMERICDRLEARLGLSSVPTTQATSS